MLIQFFTFLSALFSSFVLNRCSEASVWRAYMCHGISDNGVVAMRAGKKKYHTFDYIIFFFFYSLVYSNNALHFVLKALKSNIYEMECGTICVSNVVAQRSHHNLVALCSACVRVYGQKIIESHDPNGEKQNRTNERKKIGAHLHRQKKIK